MNLEISTGDYATDYSRARGDPLAASSTASASTLPHTAVMLKKDPEHWRTTSASTVNASSSGGFGLANLLNRNASGSAGPLHKFSLPSLNAFSIPRSDPSMHSSRSILSDSSMPSAAGARPNENAASPTDALMNDGLPKTLMSRRIAPAPMDDDDLEADDTAGNGADSIRGGRWSTDEHDRFLAGFRIHGHKWKRVQQVVRTRSVTQVRTHAQKYLLKLAKLKAEKKQDTGGMTIDDEQLRPRLDSVTESDVSMTQSTVDEFDTSSHNRSPMKKPRYQGRYESVDEEYIAAAASTLCFLMRQKIDSIFDARPEDDRDLEPYDCYSAQLGDSQASRKRPYMHFITDASDEYSYGGDQQVAAEASACAIESKQLCSS